MPADLEPLPYVFFMDSPQSVWYSHLVRSPAPSGFGSSILSFLPSVFVYLV